MFSEGSTHSVHNMLLIWQPLNFYFLESERHLSGR